MTRRRHDHERLGCRAQADPESLYGLMVNWTDQVGPAAPKRPRLENLQPHFLIQGMTGSGKTTVMKMLMHSVLPDQLARPGDRYDLLYRGLIYDAKNDLLPFLNRMCLREGREVILTNPFDRRSSSWNIASDVTSSADADSFAGIVVTADDSGPDQFWQHAAREVVAGVVRGLLASAPGAWDLRDLVHVVAEDHLLSQVLARTDAGRRAAGRYLGGDLRLAGSVLATVQRHVSPYRLIAALWERAETTFCFRRWREGTGVVLVGNHYRHADAIARVNNLLVRSAVESVMDVPDEEEDDLTFFFLDELRYAGRFPGFGQLLNQGRSKGARAVLAVQGMSGLKLVFGENGAGEVANACGNKCLLQLADPQDAEWASRLFATAMGRQLSVTYQPDGKMSMSRSEKEVNVIPAADFMKLPNAQDHDGAITGYYHHPGGRFMPGHAPPDRVDSAMPPRRPAGTPVAEAFEPRSRGDDELTPMRSDDYQRLGLTPSAQGPNSVLASGSQRPAFVMPEPLELN